MNTETENSVSVVFVKVDDSFLDSDLPMAMQFDAWRVLVEKLGQSSPQAVLVDFHFGSRRFEKQLPGAATAFENALEKTSGDTVLIMGVPPGPNGNPDELDILAGIRNNPHIRKACMLLVADADEVVRDFQSNFPADCPAWASMTMAAAAAQALGFASAGNGLILPKAQPKVEEIEASRVLSGQYNSAFFNNKIVSIGSGFAYDDEHLSSHFAESVFLHSPVKGTLIHALNLQALLEHRVAVKGDVETWALGVLSALVISLTCLFLGRFVLPLVLLSLGAMVLELVTVNYFRLYLELFYPAALGLAASLVIVLRRTLSNLLLKRKLQNLLGGLLSPDVLKRCMENPEGFFKAKRYQNASVLVLDIQGYTRDFSRMDVSDLFQISNEFMGFCARTVHSHGGCVERFRGDGLLAYFGAPLETEGHSDQAVQAALDILQGIAQTFSKEFGFFKDRIRIGISSGELILGQVGNPERFDISVTGQSANRAAHFESLAQPHQYPVVIDAPSLLACKESYKSTGLDFVHPKHPGLPLCGLAGFSEN